MSERQYNNIQEFLIDNNRWAAEAMAGHGAGIRHKDACVLSQVFNAYCHFLPQDQQTRINEWLKSVIEAALEAEPPVGSATHEAPLTDPHDISPPTGSHHDSARWVSLNERWPEVHELVLVWEDENRYLARRVGDWFEGNNDGKGMYGVTHWQPLSEPPK